MKILLDVGGLDTPVDDRELLSVICNAVTATHRLDSGGTLQIASVAATVVGAATPAGSSEPSGHRREGWGRDAADRRLREHAAALGDRDFWLSRTDASVVCHAIRLSLPRVSWRGLHARICRFLCRYSRIGDAWMDRVGAHSEVHIEPVSIEALTYLRNHGSAALLADVRLHASANRQVRHREDAEPVEIELAALYDVLGAGAGADRLRALAREAEAVAQLQAWERETHARLAQEQRRLLAE